MLLHTRARLLTHRHLFLVSNGAELSCPPRTKNKTNKHNKENGFNRSLGSPQKWNIVFKKNQCK